ncbi:MAG: MFS transporter [Bacteroidota bacterium]
MPTRPPRYILPVIVLAQFAGTSLWFAGNAILPDLQVHLALEADAIGAVTSAVQLGFIIGTLLFAFLSIADRVSPSRVFWICAWLGAAANLGVFLAEGLSLLLFFRFLVGFFLAGIYPVGMKIASDWYAGKLGTALGWLVGALVLGTAFPHGLRGFTAGISWQGVIVGTSLVAALGGIAVGLGVGDGPNRKAATQFNPSVLLTMFRAKPFRAAAFGYFGHMWELYTFWAFVPWLLSPLVTDSDSLSVGSFVIIALGSVGCVLGGYRALRTGSHRVAAGMLLTSGLCCLVAPWVLLHGPVWLQWGLLAVWGFAVVGDSPQFSTLAARTAPPASIGTALTLVNSLGFALTIVSIQVLNMARSSFPESLEVLWLLLPGPVLGLWAIRPLLRSQTM